MAVKKKSTAKPLWAGRLDPVLIEKARAKGLDISSIFESALARILGDNRCPYCGAEKKGK